MFYIYVLDLVCSFFFFKQKTAYEMRISDWSSDVCSSDLELYDEIGDLFGLDQSVRDEVANYNGRPSRLYDRTIRWAMQDCKRQGWLFSEERGNWQITDAGNEALGRVKPGVQITIFRTELGQIGRAHV